MEGPDHGLPTWVQTGIVSIIVGLAGFVVGGIRYYLVKEAREIEKTQKDHTDQIKELKDECECFKIVAEECRKDRASQDVRIAVLEERARLQDTPNLSDENDD